MNSSSPSSHFPDQALGHNLENGRRRETGKSPSSHGVGVYPAKFPEAPRRPGTYRYHAGAATISSLR